MKTIRYICLFLLLSTTVIWSQTDWGVPTMSVDAIKPGMTGTGKTVFYGSNIEDFGFEIIEVVKNYYPKQDIILVRLTGEQAEKNGVVSGMSGSPMYIDDLLIGALAMRFGSFMKDAIGGVVPIGDMYRVSEFESTRNQETAVNTAIMPHYVNAALCGADENLWQDMASTIIQSPPAANSSLSHIQSPLLFSGFDTRLVAQYSPLFEPMGFTVVTGGSGGSSDVTGNIPLQPGSAVSQVFITGDLSIESTGTVTAVHNQSLLAFGHYIFNLGPINLPLAKANILATLPSLMGSTKMAASEEIVGTFRQDRLTGVYGELGTLPDMVPVDIQFETVAGKNMTYHFEMVQDGPVNNIVPLFLRTAMIQALTTGRLAGSLNSLQFDCSINFDDGRSINMNDFFSSDPRFGFVASGTDANQAADLLASILGVLMVNDFKSPTIKSIQVNAKEIKGERIAQIKNIWQNKKTVSPNDTISFSIEMESTDNHKFKLNRSFPIPGNLDARRMSILISSAATLTRYEVQTRRSKFVPVNFDHLLTILGERRKNNQLYIQILVNDRGLFLEGQEMSALPPSVLNVMGTIKTNGSSRNVQDRILYEEAIPTDYVVTGAKRLSVRVTPPSRAVGPDDDEGNNNPAQPMYW